MFYVDDTISKVNEEHNNYVDGPALSCVLRNCTVLGVTRPTVRFPKDRTAAFALLREALALRRSTRSKRRFGVDGRRPTNELD